MFFQYIFKILQMYVLLLKQKTILISKPTLTSNLNEINTYSASAWFFGAFDLIKFEIIWQMGTLTYTYVKCCRHIWPLTYWYDLDILIEWCQTLRMVMSIYQLYNTAQIQTSLKYRKYAITRSDEYGKYNLWNIWIKINF